MKPFAALVYSVSRFIIADIYYFHSVVAVAAERISTAIKIAAETAPYKEAEYGADD